MKCPPVPGNAIVFILAFILLTALAGIMVTAECTSDIECRAAFNAADSPTSEDFQQLLNPTSEDFQRLGDPTAADLQLLAHPQVGDFLRLDDAEQREYILSSEFKLKDQEIAAEYFSRPGNINRDKVAFSWYAKSRRVDIMVRGDVRDFSRDGLLQGQDPAGRNWGINLFDGRITGNFALEVDRDGSLVMMSRRNSGRHIVSGTIEAENSLGELKIEEGAIDSHGVRDAHKIIFLQDSIVQMETGYVEGITFERSTEVTTRPDGTVDILLGRIISMEPGYRVYVKGSFVVNEENYGDIWGELLVKSNQAVEVNELRIFSPERDTALRFQRPPLTRREHFRPFLAPLLGPESQSVIFAPGQVAAEGSKLVLEVSNEFIQELTDGISSLAEFDFVLQGGRLLVGFDSQAKRLQIAAQGNVEYLAGPQSLKLSDGRLHRFFGRSVSAVTLGPVDFSYFGDDGQQVGELHHADFLAAPSKGRRVLTSMGSTLESLSLMRSIAIGDPEEISAINSRIEQITEQWDRGIQPSEEDLIFVEGVYKAIMAGSRVAHGSTAARTLYHYLEATGEPLEYDPKIFLRRREVQYAMKHMEEYARSQLTGKNTEITFTTSVVPATDITTSEAAEMEGLDPSNFGYVSPGIIWTPDEELRYSFGKFDLRAQARRVGREITVEWSVEDIYDYERDSHKPIAIPTGQVSSALDRLLGRKSQGIAAASVVPVTRSGGESSPPPSPSIGLPDRLAAYLTDVGLAREFKMESKWKTRCDLYARYCTAVEE